MKISIAILAAAGLAVPTASVAQQPDPAQVREFSQAANASTTCLGATVKVGMMAKMDPAVFKEGFAKSCMDEQLRFRALAIEVSMATGKLRADAEAEIDGNIANGRRIYADDQERYIRTGRVPK